MNIYVNGKDLVVGAPLSSHVETQFHGAVAKYLDHALDAILRFYRKGYDICADITFHPGLRDLIDQSSGNADDVDEDPQPAIIAEMSTEIVTITVSKIFMRMEQIQFPALMIKNKANEIMNNIYSSNNINIGWIEPANTAS